MVISNKRRDRLSHVNSKCLFRTQPVCLNTLFALEDLHTREDRLTFMGESLQEQLG